MPIPLRRFFESEVQDDRIETEVENETFLLRPLNSAECMEYGEIQGKTDRTLYLLKHGLRSGEPPAELSDEGIERILAENEPMAMELAERIHQLTSEVYREEKKRWEDAKKKLERDPYLYLRRAYCRRYRIDPTVCRVTKSELIEDAAFDAVLPPKPEIERRKVQEGIPANLFFKGLKELFTA